MPSQIFISYASSDSENVSAVRDDLETDGLDCWMAPRDVPPGGDYAEVIPAAIQASGIMLVFLSEAANASDHVQREVHLAVADDRPILPIRLEAVLPTGALTYLLTGTQWIDAFPRVQPSLGLIRRGARQLLQRAGRNIHPSIRRTRFQRVLSTAAGWLAVAGLTLLLLTWVQRTWFNLVSVFNVPVVAMKQAPLVIIGLAAVPFAAVAVQFWLHRDLSRAVSLDALLGAGMGTGAARRSAVAAGLACLLASAIWFAPPTVSIGLESTPIDQYNAALTRALTGEVRNYVAQCRSHFVVSTRVGRLNPPGRYTLRVELSPYATRDGIEFGDLLIDPRLGATQVERQTDDQRMSGSVEVNVPFDLIAGERTIRVKAIHYRDSHPADARIGASVALADHLRVDAPARTVPASLFCSD